MKHIYLSILTVAVAGGVQAQQMQPRLLDPSASATMHKYSYTGVEQNEMPAVLAPFDNRPQHDQVAGREFTQWIIGGTYYDLQSNSSAQNRIIGHNGARSGAWTMSWQTSAYTDRGTGYNFSPDLVWPEIPYDRLESVRTGWPSILRTAGGKEVIINHDFPNELMMLSRDYGSGDWTEETIVTSVPEKILWPRAVAGGADGNSIHMIALSAPSGNQTNVPPLTYEGLDGAIVYWRSQDEGETWDVQDYIIPGMDASLFTGFRADSYAIHASGDKVAIAVFNTFADSFVMISEDNGETWEKQILLDIPVDLYTGNDEIIDINMDGFADTLLSTDNAGAVYIDSNGLTHALWGDMFYLDDVLGDDAWTFFPLVDGLEYWNENMGENTSQTIALIEDIDESGEIEFGGSYALYYVSQTGIPQMGEDGDGNLYVSYMGMVETHLGSSDQNYHHLYLMKSTDGGMSWSDPIDFTPDEDFDFYEVSFPSMDPVVDDYVHIVYQRDFEPGLSARGDMDGADLNDIVYIRISNDLEVEEVVGVDETSLFAEAKVYPNPASSDLIISLPTTDPVQFRIVDVSGRTVLTDQILGGQAQLNVETLESGVYLIHLSGNADSGIIRFVKE